MLYRLILLSICLHAVSTVQGQQRVTFPCEQTDFINEPDTSLWGLSLNDFVKKSSLVKPNFTGGTVTFVSAVNGLSLIVMSLQISKSKMKDSNQTRKVDSVLKELQAKQGLLACLAEMDNIVFRDFLRISKLPAGSESEKKRKDSIRTESLIQATELPLKGAETIVQCLMITHKIDTLFTKNVYSDVAAGSLLMAATLDGLLLMADSNVSGLPEGHRSAFFNRSNRMSKSSKAELSAILAKIKITK